MNELVPLAAAPAVAAAAWWRVRVVRAVHGQLRAVINDHPGAPIHDAGTATLQAVAASLALDPSEIAPHLSQPRPRVGTADQVATWEARETVRLLGLDVIEVVRAEQRARAIHNGTAARGRSEMAGERHGRRVVVRLRETSSLVTVDGAVESFSIHAANQEWFGADEAPETVREWLEDLSPTTRWNGVCVDGGPAGVALRRDEESARSWMHDLWLAEQLADVAAVRRASPA